MGEGGLDRYREEPFLDDGRLVWRPGPTETLDETILAPVAKPFSATAASSCSPAISAGR